MLRKRRRKKRAEQWWGLPKLGQGLLKWGVRRCKVASWSYLLHLPSLLFLSFMTHGGKAEESES